MTRMRQAAATTAKRRGNEQRLKRLNRGGSDPRPQHVAGRDRTATTCRLRIVAIRRAEKIGPDEMPGRHLAPVREMPPQVRLVGAAKADETRSGHQNGGPECFPHSAAADCIIRNTRRMKDRDHNARTVYSSAAGKDLPRLRPARTRLPLRRRSLPRRYRCGPSPSCGWSAPAAAARPSRSSSDCRTTPRFCASWPTDLKKACGTGGTVTDDGVELQGDLRDRVRDVLVGKGFGVKG